MANTCCKHNMSTTLFVYLTTRKELVMMTHRLLALVIPGVTLLSACANGMVPQTLAPQAQRTITAAQQSPASSGDQVYEGQVYALDGRPALLFRYERRVHTVGRDLVSTHLTYDPTGAVVVIQSAVHTPRYELVRADLIHGQSGASGSVEVSGQQVTFRLNEGGRVSTAHENLTDPVVSGPTMFGYILAHWDELMSGASLPIRFAVLERSETIGFALDKVESASPGRTVIRMKPSNVLVRIAVAPTYFEFDTATRRILEYTGRVPPLETVNDRLRTLDARVAYHFVAADFR